MERNTHIRLCESGGSSCQSPTRWSLLQCILEIQIRHIHGLNHSHVGASLQTEPTEDVRMPGSQKAHTSCMVLSFVRLSIAAWTDFLNRLAVESGSVNLARTGSSFAIKSEVFRHSLSLRSVDRQSLRSWSAIHARNDNCSAGNCFNEFCFELVLWQSGQTVNAVSLEEYKFERIPWTRCVPGAFGRVGL